MSNAITSSTTTDGLITCFIAGGAGFIGSYLCEKLLDQNCFVYCVDTFSTGREANIESLKANPHFKLIHTDLSNVTNLELERSLDYVFHVAAIEAYMNGLDVDMDTLLINSFGTRALLQLAYQQKAKFLLGSSEQIYHPFHVGENFDDYFGDQRADQGTHVFVEAKRFSESLTVEYAKEKGVDARIVRLAFLYGPRMSVESGSLLTKILIHAVGEKKIPLPNDGMAIAYPTFISDAVYGLIKAMFSQSSRGKIYGVLNTQPVTLLQFAHLIESVMHESLQIEFKLTDRELSAEILPQEVLKSQEALGWYPRTDLEAGLKKTIEWLRQQRPQLVRMAEFSSPPVVRPSEVVEVSRPSVPSPAPMIASALRSDQAQRPLAFQPQPAITDVKPGVAAEVAPGFVSSHTPRVPLAATVHPVHQAAQTHRQEVVHLSWRDRLQLVRTSLPRFHRPSPTHSAWSSWGWPVLGGVGTLVVLLGLAAIPYGLLSSLTASSLDNLARAREAVPHKNWEVVGQQLTQAQEVYPRLQQWYSWMSWYPAKIRAWEPAGLSLYMEHGERLLKLLQSLHAAEQSFETLIEVIFDRELGDPAALIEATYRPLDQAREELLYLEAELSPQEQAQLHLDVVSVKSWVTGAHRLTQILPDLLAVDGRKTWLVMLQDEHELRASGGFLEAVAVVTVEKGRLLDVEVMDVYELDHQLKGSIKPPEVIEKYLGSSTWLLRDANIALDFPEAAARTAWFVQKQIGKTADGILALNYQVFERLLGQTGRLSLAGIEEEVHATSLQQQALDHAQINFTTDAAGGKRTFMAQLAEAWYAQLQTMPSTDFVSLIPPLYDSLSTRQLMIWLPDSSSQVLLEQWGWDGAVRQPPRELTGFGSIALADYLAVSELNLGVNKVNPQVKRQLDHRVEVTAEGATVTTQWLLSNTAQTTSWPDGSYKVYVEVLVPEEAVVSTVKTGASTTSLKLVNARSLTTSVVKQKRVLGLFVDIPIRKEQVIEVSYQLATEPKEANPLPYVLYLQKQSGTSQTPVTVTVEYPPHWQVERLSQEAQVAKGTIQFHQTLDTDQVFAVSFAR